MNIKAPKYYTHSDLEKLALELQAKYQLTVPVDIDYLVGMLNIEIRDLTRLKEDFSLFGLLAKVSGQYVIIVQQGELKVTNYQTSFTIAEELSHYILHKDYFNEVMSVEDAVQFYGNLAQKSGMMFEFNAKHLAGAILVPKDDLITRAMKVYSDNRPLFEKIMHEGNEDSCETIINAVASSLSDVYRVPGGDIAYRLRTSIVGFKKFMQGKYQDCKR